MILIVALGNIIRRQTITSYSAVLLSIISREYYLWNLIETSQIFPLNLVLVYRGIPFFRFNHDDVIKCVWINGWVNNHETGHLRRHRAHYGVTVMISVFSLTRARVWYIFASGNTLATTTMGSLSLNDRRCSSPGQNGRHSGRRHFHLNCLERKCMNFA